MSTSISEKGHAKNIANLQLLITNIEALGGVYNSTHPRLALSHLQELHEQATTAQMDVNRAIAPYKTAVAERENTFKPLSKLVTKLRKVYKSTDGVEINNLENFMTIARKIKGSKKVSNTDSADPAVQVNTHSASQLSYDQRTNSLEQLIFLLSETPNYNPNEVEYTIETLQTLRQEMLSKTAAVAQAYVPLNNFRSARNNAMYLSNDNLVDIAYKAKDYLFTILDSKSVQYKAISRIKFSRI